LIALKELKLLYVNEMRTNCQRDGRTDGQTALQYPLRSPMWVDNKHTHINNSFKCDKAEMYLISFICDRKNPSSWYNILEDLYYTGAQMRLTYFKYDSVRTF